MQVIYSFNFTRGTNKNGVQINNISTSNIIILDIVVAQINNVPIGRQ